MIKAIGKWWRKRQRQEDMKILWPACLEAGGKRFQEGKGEIHTVLHYAKAAFACHAFNDKAWTKDFSPTEIEDFIGRLRPGDRVAP